MVVEVGPNDYVAFYFRTPYEAIRTAQEGRWCEQAARPWFIATTYPIDGYEPVRRFLSMEADRITAQLRER